MYWKDIQGIRTRSYVCGYCGESIASNKGYIAKISHSDIDKCAEILICHKCDQPTFFGKDGEQIPGVKYGESIPNLPEDIEKLYDEARNSFSMNAFTCTVMCGRKILMHVAISQGAEENKRYVEYVQYLADNNIIPKNSQGWVDIIRSLGNDANHEIILNTEEEATQILDFIELLFRIVYEYPARIPKQE